MKNEITELSMEKFSEEEVLQVDGPKFLKKTGSYLNKYIIQHFCRGSRCCDEPSLM